MKIRIPLIITSDDRWAAMAAYDDRQPDWALIDEMCDPQEETKSPEQFFVEVEDPRGSDSKVVIGTAIPADAA